MSSFTTVFVLRRRRRVATVKSLNEMWEPWPGTLTLVQYILKFGRKSSSRATNGRNVFAMEKGASDGGNRVRSDRLEWSVDRRWTDTTLTAKLSTSGKRGRPTLSNNKSRRRRTPVPDSIPRYPITVCFCCDVTCLSGDSAPTFQFRAIILSEYFRKGGDVWPGLSSLSPVYRLPRSCKCVVREIDGNGMEGRPGRRRRRERKEQFERRRRSFENERVTSLYPL